MPFFVRYMSYGDGSSSLTLLNQIDYDHWGHDLEEQRQFHFKIKIVSRVPMMRVMSSLAVLTNCSDGTQ
jgi:hypothetical protein